MRREEDLYARRFVAAQVDKALGHFHTHNINLEFIDSPYTSFFLGKLNKRYVLPDKFISLRLDYAFITKKLH